MRITQISGSFLLLGLLPVGVFGTDILKTNGFSTCTANSDIQVNNVDVQYDRSTERVTFDVSGTSSKEQKVTASLTVTAYGKQVYQKDFDPCAQDTKVDQLCPVPAGKFAAQGSQSIPSNFANDIPAIAFSVPDLDGQAKLELKAADGGQDLACIQSSVSNGKTVEVPAVSYIAAGVAGAALILTGVSALGSGGHPGAHTPSPSFGEVVGWFQSMAFNGMLSVNYPPVYRSFTKNFAFSTGLIPWSQMQTSIDNFRQATGGNLTEDSVPYLQNATLVYTDGSQSNVSTVAKRGIDFLFDAAVLSTRDVSTNVNGTGSASGNSTSSGNSKASHLVHGIQGYVEQLTIPQANTFMTVLLIFAIVIAAIAVGILLFKVILETWALFGSFPKKLSSFRRDYWGLMARTITNLILILYGVWTLYCIFQFTQGDSWAAKLLAGITLGMFTAVLVFFTFRIWQLAHKYKRAEGDASGLYENKETWRKYSLFYDNYKKGYWWLFLPAIVYMFAKGTVIAAGDGHGLVQSAGQLIIEALMLILLLWSRPYVSTSGNWINVVIQIVRVLSVVCILVFVEELGIAQSTKTITGVVLIAVQSGLTGVLAILIAVNSIIICCRENPHRKRRKEAEKMNRDIDNLTPLDARNSLLMEPTSYKADQQMQMKNFNAPGPYEPYREQGFPQPRFGPRESSENLVSSAAGMGHRHNRSTSRESSGVSPPPRERQPTLPNLNVGGRAF